MTMGELLGNWHAIDSAAGRAIVEMSRSGATTMGEEPMDGYPRVTPEFVPVRGASTAVQQDRNAKSRKALAHRKAVKQHKAAMRRAGKR